MSIEIVHDKYDLLFVRVAGIYKVFDFLSPVGCSTVFTDSLSGKRDFTKDLLTFVSRLEHCITGVNY